MSAKLLEDFAARFSSSSSSFFFFGGGALQSAVKWYNEKKEKEREKEGQKGTETLDRRVGAAY